MKKLMKKAIDQFYKDYGKGVIITKMFLAETSGKGNNVDYALFGIEYQDLNGKYADKEIYIGVGA